MLAAVLFTATGFGQTIKGTVKDTTGKAVPYATVSLKRNATIVAYAQTDSKGGYTLTIIAQTGDMTIEVHHFGYQTAVKNVLRLDAPIDFTLAASVNELKEVVIKSNRPFLKVNGDTLSYKVAEFASPQDRTIGEVIKKLPGISVAANGTISYNNKPISALYIDGDNLLDDKYSIAANSIPQTAVNQVQVLQNNQPIRVLQNKVPSEDVALNLTFKKGAKLHLMGQESIGAGLPGSYDVDLNAMMFKDSYKAINYLAGNNTGYDVQQDLVSHNLSEYNQRIDHFLPPALLSLGAVNTPQLAQNRYLFDRSGVLNLNNLVNLQNNVQLKINAYYVHDTQKQDYSQQTTVFLPGDTVKYSEVQHNRLVPDIFHTQFTLNINRQQYYLNDALLLDRQNTTGYSALRTAGSAVDQVFQDHLLNFSNELNLIRALKSGHMIQFYSYVSHSAEPENLSISPEYNAAIFNHNVPYAQLVQQVNIPSWYTNNYLAFRLPSGLFTQSYRTGFSIQSQNLVSDLNVVQNNNSSALLSDSARNHVSWTKKKLYAEAAYDLPGEFLKAHLALPLTLQQINYADKTLTRLYLNSQLNAKYQVSAENYINLNYSYRNQTGTIADVYPGYILTNYRTLYANNASLTQHHIQQASAGFSYRKAITLFFWSLNVAYSHTRANNIASSVITNSIQQGIVLPFANSTDSWILGGSVSKYSFALRSTFSGAVQWQSSRSLQLQNNVLLPFNTITETANVSADTKLTDQLNVSYKATLTQMASHSRTEASANQIDQLVQQAALNYEPVEALQFKLSGEHYFTRQQGNPDLKYFFADAALKFRAIKWKTDFELTAANFLNVKTYNALYLSANTLTASSYTLPGRIILLKVLFNL
jgi:hypothetical protein